MFTIIQNKERDVEVFDKHGDLIFYWSKNSRAYSIANDLVNIFNQVDVLFEFMTTEEWDE